MRGDQVGWLTDGDVRVAVAVSDHVNVWGYETHGDLCGIDGGGGQNPFIDKPSARYPLNKDDFELNWRTQCLDLGYKEG